jgi:hypothetical protein
VVKVGTYQPDTSITTSLAAPATATLTRPDPSTGTSTVSVTDRPAENEHGETKRAPIRHPGHPQAPDINSSATATPRSIASARDPTSARTSPSRFAAPTGATTTNQR